MSVFLLYFGFKCNDFFFCVSKGYIVFKQKFLICFDLKIDDLFKFVWIDIDLLIIK